MTEPGSSSRTADAAPAVARDLGALRAHAAAWRRAGETLALVPTMGALHEGHLALVEAGRRRADRVVVSIFVNPKQFARSEGFALYPRTEAQDLALLAGRADLVFAPEAAVLYPEGFATSVEVGGSIVADLEAAARPGHFIGVATVVTKLFLQAGADYALFGEKDYQQLRLVQQLVRDLDLPLQVVAVPTVRDAEGLALSSRNRALDARQLAIARQLNKLLRAIAAQPARLATGEAELLALGFDAVDYLALRDAETLAEPRPGRPRRLLAAARLGATRLLDNWPVAANQEGTDE